MLSYAHARREFLKIFGLGTLGFAYSKSAFAHLKGAEGRRELLLYVGTYTSRKSKGIYLYRFDLSSGELKHVATTETVDPSFLTLSPNRRYLYAVNELRAICG